MVCRYGRGWLRRSEQPWAGDPGYVLNADDCNDTPGALQRLLRGDTERFDQYGSCTYLLPVLADRHPHPLAFLRITCAPCSMWMSGMDRVHRAMRGSYIYHYDGTGEQSYYPGRGRRGKSRLVPSAIDIPGEQAGFMNGASFFQVKTNTASPASGARSARRRRGYVMPPLLFPPDFLGMQSFHSRCSRRISGGTTLQRKRDQECAYLPRFYPRRLRPE